MDIEERPLKTLDIVEVPMNNEVAINNDSKEFRKILTNLTNKENKILPKSKSTCSW